MERIEQKKIEDTNIAKGPFLSVLMAGVFIAILNQTLLATALPHIMDDLSITANTAQWLTTVFMLVNGVMIPITAFLIGKFSTRNLFFVAMGLFAAGTVICALAPGFSVLMVGRIVQAAGAGIMMPLTQTVLFIIFPVEKRGQAMGLFGLVISFAPAIGPTLSGWIVGQYPWRALFYIVVPIALLDLILAYFFLKNVTKQTFPVLDILSIVLSTLGFGGILYGFSSAGSLGWDSPAVSASILVGIVSLLFFIRRQFRLDQPILEFRVFSYSIFTLSTVLSVIVFISMIGSATILPIYMQNMHGFTALESGLMLLPGAIIMGLMNPIAGRIFDKVGGKWLAVTGLSIVTVSTFQFTVLTATTSFLYLTIMHAIRMFGVALVMMPVTTAGLNQLPERLIPHGTAMSNTMRQVSGSIGTALLVTIMTSTALDPEQYGVQGLIRGVNISFFVVGVLSIIGVVLAFFLRKADPGIEERGE
ncbi:DHA2 family efflux MFS transporter permease subunit [Planococcus sp. ISL-110]|uniref:DHA2 family efflux MFS transporter permease subunit n=1 Tax=Planococcus sp. ISL-110 TaxID=2819167 RepID=UPI001BEA72A4|nr:DHA2 family efflux MFS transporter permease subunit [Planococcus sp. ISL-110]MBT2569992.1 DHA2 family efflux MFS transporter permease subunit [Planococcus sp. ISL-110]